MYIHPTKCHSSDQFLLRLGEVCFEKLAWQISQSRHHFASPPLLEGVPNVSSICRRTSQIAPSRSSRCPDRGRCRQKPDLEPWPQMFSSDGTCCKGTPRGKLCHLLRGSSMSASRGVSPNGGLTGSNPGIRPWPLLSAYSTCSQVERHAAEYLHYTNTFPDQILDTYPHLTQNVWRKNPQCICTVARALETRSDRPPLVRAPTLKNWSSLDSSRVSWRPSSYWMMMQCMAGFTSATRAANQEPALGQKTWHVLPIAALPRANIACDRQMGHVCR